MRSIRQVLAVTGAAALMLLAPQALAKTPAQATADAVRAADAAFAARAQAVSTAQAFHEYMDETDGLQFNGGPPLKGAEAIWTNMGGAAAKSSDLAWTPVDAWGAASGDLGVTTGTWVFTRGDAAHTRLTGRYVTVWRKDAKGKWKGLIDIGTDDPPPTSGTPAAKP